MKLRSAPLARMGLSGSRILILASIVLAYAVFWTLYSLFVPEQQYLPHPENMALLMVCVLVILQIENRYCRYAMLFWCFWFGVGAVSLFAMNNLTRGLNYNVDASAANRFYLLCVLAGALGALLVQPLFAHQRPGPTELRRGKNPLMWLFILLFPILYFLSIVLATGDVPLFSGRDVSSVMYEVDYGPLHGFGIFIPVACLMIWMAADAARLQTMRQLPAKIFVMSLLLAFLVIGSTDGRRVLTLFAVMAIILFYLEKAPSLRRIAGGLVFGLLAIVAYIAAAVVRSGRSFGSGFSSAYEPFAAVGVEYRDYVWSHTNLLPEVVRGAGYDWFGSTFASATPGFLLSLMSIDKAALTQSDSARTLMKFFNVELGIRIGLPGELWFAVGWAGIAMFALFGIAVAWLAHRAARSAHYVYKSIWLVGLSIATLSVLGQSTVTFGLILPLVYLAILTWLVESLFRFNISIKGTSPVSRPGSVPANRHVIR